MTKDKRRSYVINLIAIVATYIILSVLIENGVINNYYSGILTMIGINIILATSLNLITGFLGQLTLGHAGFMSVGAYTAAICSLHMNLPDPFQFPLSLLIGMLFAAIFGTIIGIPALRLRGDYLAIITLGFGEIIRVIILNLDVTGGAKGLFGTPFKTNFTNLFIIVVCVIFVLWTLIHSRHGRAIMAIRENEIAAEATGVSLTNYKLLAFVIGAALAGLAGGLYAHYIPILDATNYDFNRSIEILVFVVLGGMGSLTGSVVAAIVLTILPEFLRMVADYRMVAYAIILIIIMIFKPSGIFGHYELSLSSLWRLTKIKGKRKR